MKNAVCIFTLFFTILVAGTCGNKPHTSKIMDAAIIDTISPRSDEVVVIGLSLATYDSTLSTTWAIENGIMRLALYLGIELNDSTLFSQGSFRGPRISRKTDESLINTEGILGISASVRILDIRENKNGIKSVAMGISHPSFRSLTGGKFPSALKTVKPQWIETLPVENGYIYALGFSQPWFNPLRALREAEQNARRSIAQVMGVQVNSEKEFIENGDGVTITGDAVFKTSEILTRTELYDFWENNNTGTVYVLVRTSIKKEQ
ncbi:LPP20 family lipoprotein [bacterium]|nr:LPP20 family lipoprotein [bacterium]